MVWQTDQLALDDPKVLLASLMLSALPSNLQQPSSSAWVSLASTHACKENERPGDP